jgi:hypothetical protein
MLQKQSVYKWKYSNGLGKFEEQLQANLSPFFGEDRKDVQTELFIRDCVRMKI